MAKVFKEDKPWIVSKPWRAEVNTADFMPTNHIGLVVNNFRTKKAANAWADHYEDHCRSVARMSASRDTVAEDENHAHH